MKNLYFLYLFLLSGTHAVAQIPEADFTAVETNGEMRFNAIVPPLPPPIPGGRQPFYTYFWEFGDHHCSLNSREPDITHTYAEAGEYYAVLTTTLHYDDGKSIKKKKKKVVVKSGGGVIASLHDAFDTRRQAIAMKAVRPPRPGEEFTVTLSYRNVGKGITNGQLYLFFNEKALKKPIFRFQEGRTHFGETSGEALSLAPPPTDPDALPWPMVSLMPHTGNHTLIAAEGEGIILDNMLREARQDFVDENRWDFTALRPGAQRNLFFTLNALPEMVKDTNMTISIDAIFAPSDPALAVEKYTLEVEIVGSHDPNLIAVSKNRANYRTAGSADLKYKVRFQNNGEGPAKKIELKVSVPEGLKIDQMKPVKWYPECPICPDNGPKTRCLDTTLSKKELIFTFYDIYLPGSHQKDVQSYDSTKGFVQYKIALDKRMPKRPFSSRASIIFDKNPPVVTNFTRTRFKPGLSPGLKAGYNHTTGTLESGAPSQYFFIGASLSPYKPWRVYPQIELLSGISGQQVSEDEAPKVISKQITGQFVNDKGMYTLPDGTKIEGAFRGVTDSVVYERQAWTRSFLTFEVPVSIRKNFARWIGAGIGVAPRIILYNGNDDVRRTAIVTTTLTRLVAPLNQTFVIPQPEKDVSQTQEPFRKTTVIYNVFADLHLGSVRAGPSVGLRGGVMLDQALKYRQPFAQICLEIKL